MELTEDKKAQEVAADIAETLGSITVDGVAAFSAVMMADDVDSFRMVADPLQGPVAGVISRPAQRTWGNSSGEAYVERLQLDIAVAVSVMRGPGEDEKMATEELQRLCALCKAALAVDISRGGRAHAISWGGQLLNRTDLRGEPRLLPRKPNQAFFVAAVPVVCGWSVAE